jgi:hypothetical protein
VRVWDAHSGECVEVFEGSLAEADCLATGTIAGSLAEMACLATGTALGTAIQSPSTGESVAWFPAALEHIVAHPSRRMWAGYVGNHLYLIVLEGT